MFALLNMPILVRTPRKSVSRPNMTSCSKESTFFYTYPHLCCNFFYVHILATLYSKKRIIRKPTWFHIWSLFQYVIGSVTSWNILAGISATVPILSFLGMLLLPETPNYLLQQDKRERAESSLAKLRGSTCNLEDEINKMIAFKEKNHVEP